MISKSSRDLVCLSPILRNRDDDLWSYVLYVQYIRTYVRNRTRILLAPTLSVRLHSHEEEVHPWYIRRQPLDQIKAQELLGKDAESSRGGD